MTQPDKDQSTEEAEVFVEVAIPLPVDDLFTYRCEPGAAVSPGHAVQVTFGRQRLTGYVINVTSKRPEGVQRIRTIDRVLDETPALSDDQIAFCMWAADYYISGLGEVIAATLPTPYRAKVRRVYHATEEGVAMLATAEQDASLSTTLLRDIVARPGRTLTGLARRLHGESEPAQVRRAVASLVRKELVAVTEQAARGPGGRIRTLHLTEQQAPASIGGARMRSVYARVVEAGGTMDLPTLLKLEGSAARSAVRRLISKGLLSESDQEDREARPLSATIEPTVAHTLNAAQKAAVDAIVAAPSGPVLLHGVTGSGKTEVYLEATARTLETGRQALILVPEIALTPQLTRRFEQRFGQQVAVLHSGLTQSDRLRQWRRIRAGDAQVAVGARSALFAPFRSLGLIVVDEEHDDSYKQDDGVRYHARDLAVLRGHQVGCPVVLGSATPALESWHNARTDRYTFVRLAERATPRPVPSLELIDMRRRPAKDPLAEETVTALREALARGGKGIVLYNRRGYAPVVECSSCGGHYSCPSCGVGMVYHQRRGTVACHYCGYRVDFNSECRACGGELSVLGHGTERVEETLRELFPEVSIGRMDADTTRTRNAHADILDRFRSGHFQLLVGTQVVAKGHDFPDVHISAIVGVDHILGMPDFRSSERTFALVKQMAGRAGRGSTAGRVLVQTRHPDHFVFRFLAGQDIPEEFSHLPPAVAATEAFWQEESRIRRILRYPPYFRLVLVRIEGTDRQLTYQCARAVAQQLRSAPDTHPFEVEVTGPIPAPLSRLVGRWRQQVVIRSQHRGKLQTWLRTVRPILRRVGTRGVRISVDVDPRSLL